MQTIELATCNRCAHLTDQEIDRLARRPLTVGRVTLTVDDRISPMALEVVMTARLQHYLRVLMEAYPRYAPWEALFPVGWVDSRSNRAAVRKSMQDVRWAISDRGVWVVSEYGRGYRLSEVP